MTIWMIRHAQSLSNSGQATTGPDDNGLSDLGYLQAKCVAKVFAEPPDWVAVSPFWRTQLTAQPLLDKFPHLKPEIWQVQEFAYLSLPADQPTTPLHRRPLSQAYWDRCDPDYSDGEGAESLQQLMQRVQWTLDRIRDHEGFGVVFSHGLFMKALLWNAIAQPTHIDKLAMQRFCGFWRSFRVPNTAILKIEVLANQQLSLSQLDIRHLPPHLRNEAPGMTAAIEVADQPS